MFIILLEFAANKAKAGQFMEGHNSWLKRGFDDKVFLLAGSLQPNAGGGIVAHNATRDEITARIADDPFVAHGVVNAEIIEITPGRVDERVAFLKS